MINGIGAGIAPLPFASGPTAAPESSSSGGFHEAFGSALNSVDKLQAGADTQISNLLQGAPNTDVSNVMVSVEKADIAFQLMMQVRNKVVSAYQDIEKMQF